MKHNFCKTCPRYLPKMKFINKDMDVCLAINSFTGLLNLIKIKEHFACMYSIGLWDKNYHSEPLKKVPDDCSFKLERELLKS